MSENIDDLAEALDDLSGRVIHSDNEQVVPSGQRPCPICGKTMHVENAFGVKMDVCQQHGVWLDLGEMQAVLSRVRSGERIGRRAAIREARRRGKVSGTLFGAWSLLLE